MLPIKPAWTIKKEGEKPEVTDVKLSEFSDRLPDYKAYKHQYQTAKEFSEGKDVLLTAGLASGKTEAAIAAIEKTGKKPAIFVYPTRALAKDQHERFVEYGIDSTIADSDHSYWREKIAKGEIEALITNPEMIWRHYRKGYRLRKYLTSGLFKTIVFDEIHFYKPAELNKILSIVRTFRKNRFIFLSATVGNPNQFCKEIEKITKRPCTHVQGKAFSSERTFLSYPGKYAETITNTSAWVIENDRKAIFFFNSRTSAEKWYLRLSNALGEDKVVLHHGALPRRDRRNAELSFKLGIANIMITVKTLQQGIDIGDCDTILHTHLPARVSDFQQREGRSGRREGVKAVSILTSHEEDRWSTSILTNKELFKRMYLESDHEHLLASAKSPLSRRIDRHDHPGFYSGHTVKLTDEKGNEIATYGVEDVPFRLAPGCLLLRGKKVYLIKEINVKERKAVATPAPPQLARNVRKGLWFKVSTITTTRVETGEMKVGKIGIRTDEVMYELDGQIIHSIPTRVSILVDAIQAAVKPPKQDPEACEAAIHLIHQHLREKGVPLDAFSHVVETNKIIVFEHPPATLHRVLSLLDPSEIEEYEPDQILGIHPRCPWQGEIPENTPTLAADIAESLKEIVKDFDENELLKTTAKSKIRKHKPKHEDKKRKLAKLDQFKTEPEPEPEEKERSHKKPQPEPQKEKQCTCGGELKPVYHAGRVYWYCQKCKRTFDEPPKKEVVTAIKNVRKKVNHILKRL